MMMMLVSNKLSLAFLAGATMVSAETFPVTWEFNTKAEINVKVGDTLEFTWTTAGFHDVYIHPTGDCTEDGSIAVFAPATQGGVATYTFVEEDALPEGNTMFFACDIGMHCENNVNQVVKVFPAESPTPAPVAPTPAPAPTAPSDMPTSAPVDSGDTDAPSEAPDDSSAPAIHCMSALAAMIILGVWIF